MNKNLLVSLLLSSIFFSCSGDNTERNAGSVEKGKKSIQEFRLPDVRNGLSLEKRKKVFQELQLAGKKASKEALLNYPKPGTTGGGGVEFRVQLKELEVAYWNEVLDSNHVELNLGDSIFTEGLKEKWALEAQSGSQD